MAKGREKGGEDEGWTAGQECRLASSLLSSRWSRDNLITFHPAHLYDGPVRRAVDLEALTPLLADLAARVGTLQVGAARMGVFTWDVACAGPGGPFILQVPAALDEPGPGGRARRDVPRLNFENMRDFAAAGLARFVLEPQRLLTLAGDVPAATFRALPEHHGLSLGRGRLRVERVEAERSWRVPLPPAATAELLAEMVAGLAYHHDPRPGGRHRADRLFINDGDFVVRRRPDGAFDVRLTAARHRATGVGPDLLLLYLIQLMAYEDYGDTTWNLIQGAHRGEMPFRVYGADLPFVPRPNDPYSHPGTQDLTADVNFTELAGAARNAGLHLFHYGPDRDLVGDDLPAVARSAAGDLSLAEFVGNPVFKALLVGRGTGNPIPGPLTSPLPLEGPREPPSSRHN